MKTPEEIDALLRERQKSPLYNRAKMFEVKKVYRGEKDIPLIELNETEQIGVANLVQSGLDQSAMRIASTMPSLYVPPLRPGIKVSEDKARKRRDFLLDQHDSNGVSIKMRYRARHLLGYGLSPVTVRPDHEGMPWWNLRDPLGCWEAPGDDIDQMCPTDSIFTYKRSRRYLEAAYPDQMGVLRKNESTTEFEVVEYNDAECTLVYVVGDKPQADNPIQGTSGAHGQDFQVLVSAPNRCEMPYTIVPHRVTLAGVMGAYDGMLPMYDMQAKMAALNYVATMRGIFPETWIVGQGQGRQAKILSKPDAIKGKMGHVEGGQIQQINMAPGVTTGQQLDRLEYAERHTGGVPSEYGGQSSTNIRTGRRGDAVLSAVIDFPIQEAQALFERSIYYENKLAFAIAKAHRYKPISMYVVGQGMTDVVPNRDFETDVHRVKYAYQGADANGAVIQGGQKMAMDAMSIETFMEQDPAVDDVQMEMDRIRAENIEKAFMASIQQMAADPASPIQASDWSKMVRLIRSDRMEMFEAFDKVHEEAQARQAAVAQGEQPEPPGLNATPVGAPGPDELAQIGPVEPSMQHLSQLMTSLRRPQMQLPQEAAALPAAVTA